MRRNFVIIFLVHFFYLTISCNNSVGSKEDSLNNIYNYLGDDQATALAKSIHSFEVFLDVNFKEHRSESEQIKAFLLFIKKNNQPDKSWKFDTHNDSIIISDFEISGLRKEIWLYGYEEDTLKFDSNVLYFYNPYEESEIDSLDELALDSLFVELENEIYEIDSVTEYQIVQEMALDSIRHLNMQRANSCSKFPYMMNKFPVMDSTIYGYIETKKIAGAISPKIVVDGLLWRDSDNYSDPYIKLIIVTEIYYHLMSWNLNQNGIYLYPKD